MSGFMTSVQDWVEVWSPGLWAQGLDEQDYNPGDSGDYNPGESGDYNPGESGDYNPGESGDYNPGESGDYNPGESGDYNPGESGDYNPGESGDYNPGESGDYNPGESGDYNPGESGDYNPGDSGDYNPGESGDYNPGESGDYNPGESGDYNPGDSGDFNTGESGLLVSPGRRLSCLHPMMWLWLISCAGSSPLSSVVHTWSGVGLEAVLPCTWKSYVDASSQTPYIQWETVTDTVFERKGERSFQGEAFRNRVDVPKEILEEGNCSLFFTDVQFGDAGIYESYLVVGQSRIKKRIFLQSVQLLVFDHKLVLSVESGKDLILEKYTSRAETLVFESSKSSELSVLWRRGGNGDTRVEESEGKLVLKRVRPSDSGVYRVMDADGLALSTAKVSVTGRVIKSTLGGTEISVNCAL
ncbi:hypothetical protein NFI96_001939 [Prochilodus magdalenae]|nr:hypothetical protein NFI96_001939 [Prochilodus magdalenae]